MPVEQVETLVIGGGQAGLTMSYRLKQRGLAHLVLERHRNRGALAQRMLGRAEIPVSELVGAAAGFSISPQRSGCVFVVRRYRRLYRGLCEFRCAADPLRRRGDAAPSRWRVRVCRRDIRRRDRRQECRGRHRPLSASHHAGPAARSGGIFQVHASRYQNPEQLPSGAVLVVGAGASGAQIAEELHRAGRRVFLSVGQHTRMPRSIADTI